MDKNQLYLAGAIIGAFALGYYIAPKEILDREVKQAGVFTVDTKQVLSATVNSLKLENKLLVYSYKGETRVSVSREIFGGLLKGKQELIIPANVTYYLDMSKLRLEDVQFNEQTKIVNVRVPKIEMGDVAFQPELARTTNGGLLTYSQKNVDEFQRINYGTARKAFVKQAQSESIIANAKIQAKSNVSSYFEIPLRIVGKPDVKVITEILE